MKTTTCENCYNRSQIYMKRKERSNATLYLCKKTNKYVSKKKKACKDHAEYTYRMQVDM
jgi:hypothetical protein